MPNRNHSRLFSSAALPLALLSLTILGVGCRERSEVLPARAREIVAEVRERHCPDSRLHLLKIEGEVIGDQMIVRGETTSPEARRELLERLRAAYPKKRIVDQVRTLPDSTVGDSSWAIVNVSVANQRREPRHSAELVNQMLLGTPIRLLKREGPWWFFVRASDGYLGWTDDGGIWITDSLGVAQWMSSPRVIVTELDASTLRFPAPGSQPVSDAVAGDVLRFLRERGDWTEVQFPDGRAGWIHSRHVKRLSSFLRTARPTPERIVHTALRFMGRPYLWGGKSPKGLDCSGFTSMVFRLNGVVLPRDANMQARIGEAVAFDSTFESLQPGDLVFFGRAPERITHVGIYVGDGQFIHSDSHIRINSLRPGAPNYSAYRRRNLRAARRLFNNLRRDERTGWLFVEGLELPRVW